MYTRAKIFQYIGIFLVGTFLLSCRSSFVALQIENSVPARDELPATVQSLTLLNRSMNDQFANFQEDSLEHHFLRKGYQLSKIVLDSLAADTTIRALADLLFASGRYDAVIPVDRNLPKSGGYETIPDTLNNELVARLCSDFQTDALMVLEKFSTKVMTDFSSEKFLNATNGFNRAYFATIDVRYEAFFRIYQPGKHLWTKEISVADTIYWESTDYTQAGVFKKLPTIKQALVSAGIKVALDIDEKISPAWIPEKRGYFLIERRDDKGRQAMNEHNYAEAARYWKEIAGSANRKIKSKAEYNLALLSELNGDIDGALDWGLKSFYSYYRYQTEAYLKKLKERKENLQKTK